MRAHERAASGLGPGARTAEPHSARFIFIDRMPGLQALPQGTDSYPDRSATVVVEMPTLGGDRLTLEDPGIDGVARFDATDTDGGALDATFLAAWQANNGRFPGGVDLVLTCGDRLAALPRTTRVRER